MPLTVTLGGVVSPLRVVEPVHDLALMAGAGGAEPSMGVASTPVEWGLGLEALTQDDFVLDPEALRAFALALSLLRSGEIKQLVAWGPRVGLEAHLEAVALQVGS